jgi:hypothetical protein
MRTTPTVVELFQRRVDLALTSFERTDPVFHLSTGAERVFGKRCGRSCRLRITTSTQYGPPCNRVGIRPPRPAAVVT